MTSAVHRQFNTLLKVEGKGILSGDEGKALRQSLDLDRHDSSSAKIAIVFANAVTAVDQEFVEEFFLPTARKVQNGEVRGHGSFMGPYILLPEGEIEDNRNMDRISHRVAQVLQGYVCTPEQLGKKLVHRIGD